MNIIADIAGQYKSFLALLKKMPDGEVISLGDMVDRGSDSNRVVDWFMNNGKAVLGNHEHMMIDCYRKTNYYAIDTWENNGGWKTCESYNNSIPENTIKWLEGLPLYMEVSGCLLSHSFVHPRITLKESTELGKSIYDAGEERIIWSREKPIRRKEYRLQICGHNSQWGLRRFSDSEGEYAISLDDSRKKFLTGLHLPTMQIFQQEYIK